MSLSAESRISRVAVYARGALVTRRVELPALPPGELDVIVSGITPLCDPGSVRAELKGERELISLQTALQIPSTTARPGASVEKVLDLRARLARLAAEKQHLEGRAGRFGSLSLQPRLRLGGRLENVDERVADALAASSLIATLGAQIDARIAELAQQMRDLQHELDAAALDDAQRASAERMGTGHPTREITLRLGGGGAVESLELIYQVAQARWWPVYTLRLSDGGKQAAWAMEALVAQSSAEDWKGVGLSLATSDLILDARLPELPSLRLGRKQTPPKKAYRPPPEGLERMFEAYDRAFVAPASVPEGRPTTVAKPVMRAEPADEEVSMTRAGMAPPPGFDMREFAAQAQAKGVGSKQRMAHGGAPPAPPPAAQPAPMMKTMSIDLGGYADMPMEPEPEQAEIEPADSWLVFDALEMGGRGRLAMRPTRESGVQALNLEYLAPAKTRDPRDTRGLFNHRYDAVGSGDVPSDGGTHRVTVGVAEAPATLKWRTVPREAPDVYKEAQLKNPFPSPLLAGPVDVYFDGSLLLVSEIERIDVGGTMSVGLGVEDRIRVARNARVDEGSAGLLGGSAVVDTEVTIDVTSSLSRSAEIEVIDRYPMTFENEIKIELVSARPPHNPYDQRERGTPILKGLRWSLPLPPSGKSQIVFRYKVTFSAKSEIVGGNRRE